MTQWDVDDRPATLFTRAYVWGMWLRRDKRAFEGATHTRREARKLQRRGNASPTWLTRLTRRVDAGSVGGMTVWTVRPRKRSAVAGVVYVHGGGYVHPLTKDYWRLVRALSAAPAEVLVPEYPLAPDATVDEVLPRLVEVIDGAGSGLPTLLMGDSAGGAIVLALAAKLRDDGGARPAGVVLLSPWLDADLAEEDVAELEPSDPMLAESGLRAAGRWWAGPRDPADPSVSPVHLNLNGLPPIDLFVGRRDILRPAVDDFSARADRDDAELHVHERAAMFHVWMTRAIPEGRQTRTQLTALVARRGPTTPS